MGIFIRVKNTGGPVAQHRTEILEDGKPLRNVIEARICPINWDESGVLTADLTICVSELEVPAEVGQMHCRYMGKRYLMTPAPE